MPNLKSGITLGILGGGQLGRMSALAAARLGIKSIIFCPEADCPASHVANQTITASYDDTIPLKQLSKACDFISYEFENIPIKTIEYLETLKPNSVFPNKKLLDVSQDRIKEKTFLNSLNIPTALWKPIRNISDVEIITRNPAFESFIIKTARFGYDGKGQFKGTSAKLGNVEKFLKQHDKQDYILEAIVPFRCEISVIVAKDINSKTITYGPILNEHKNQILHQTHFPANLSVNQNKEALSIATRVADSLGLRGVLTVELFVTNEGNLLANEIAPRTHNSGHWTIDACTVSQFENHVRSVCGLPVGASDAHSDARMLNLIGDDFDTAHTFLDQAGACLHLYGKTEAKAGRKMGHVTFLTPKTNKD